MIKTAMYSAPASQKLAAPADTRRAARERRRASAIAYAAALEILG